MFNISDSVFLESNHEPIGCDIVKKSIRQTDYFSNSLNEVKSIKDEYNKAKAELYKGLVDSDDGPESKMLKSVECGEGQIPVKESEDSTTQFVMYFGKSVQVLNKAVGNIINSTTAAKNQATIMQNEACDSTGYFLKKAKASRKASNTLPGNGIDAGGWVTEGMVGVCSRCGCDPCNCRHMEKVYCFDTKGDIPTLKDSEYCNDELEDPIKCKFKDNDYYQEKYYKLVDGMKHFMRKFRGLLAKCGECEEAEFASKLHEAYCTSRKKVVVDEDYLNYCRDVVEHYAESVDKVKANANSIAAGYKTAIENISRIAEISESKVSVDENGAAQLLTEEEVQAVDLYCKAEIDKLVTMCNAHLLSISAKLVSMQDEFNQCKAVLDKYVNGINTVENLPKDGDDEEDDEEKEEKKKDDDDDEKEGEKKDDDDDDDDDEKKDGDIVTAQEPINGTASESVRERLHKYTDFLFEMSQEDMVFNRYINETVLNGVDGVELVTEGVVSAVKNGVHRVMNFLGSLWGKFVNAMSSLFKKDQDYLKDNKNIIFGNKIKDATLSNWYDFNIERINNATIPDFRGMDTAERFALSMNSATAGMTNDVDQEIKDCQSTDDVISKYFSEYKNDNYDSFADMVKFYLRGEAKSINATELNGKMETLYNFCFNYNSSIKPKLDEDIKKLNKASESALKSLNALEQVKGEDKAPEGVQHFDGKTNPEGKVTEPVKIGETKTPEGQTSNNASYTYDKMLADYFNEEGVGIKTNSGTTSTGSGGTDPKDNNLNIKANSDEKNAEIDDQVRNAKSKEAKDTGFSKVNEEQKKMIGNYIDSIFKVDQSFLNAKLDVVHACYKQYMAIIRWHVGQYKGSKAENKDSVNNNNQVGTDNNQATTIKV